jgi:hypothetical protein
MAPSDSDSSDGDDDDYTETSVLLGYASQKPSDDTISHLGGQPVWLDFQYLSYGNYLTLFTAHLVLTIGGFADMARAVHPAICSPCAMQSVQRSHGASPTTEWRST